MRNSVIGRLVAALFLLVMIAPAWATMTYPPSAGSTVTGGNCAALQAANGISTAGAPTGCLNVPLPPHPGYSSGMWYQGLNPAGTTATSGAPVVGGQYFSLFYIPTAQTLTGLAVGTPGGPGTSNLQLAVYKDDGSGTIHRPGALVASTADIADTSTSSAASVKAATPVSPGWYWFAWTANDTAVRAKIKTNSNNGDAQMMGSTSAVTLAGSSPPTGVYITGQTYGTWQASFVGTSPGWTETNTMAAVPIVQFQ